MKRLLEAELIYGRLLPVDEPHLIERYNKALTASACPRTKLKSFEHRHDRLFAGDCRGARRLRDYLDPNRVNRRFIILTPEQVNLPVVHTSFSNTAALMHEFFRPMRGRSMP
jgi:hypothetical protein